MVHLEKKIGSKDPMKQIQNSNSSQIEKLSSKKTHLSEQREPVKIASVSTISSNTVHISGEKDMDKKSNINSTMNGLSSKKFVNSSESQYIEYSKKHPECFDFVIFGTGISESILSAILAQSKYKVLQLDSSDKYGSSFKTLNYIDLCYEYNKRPHETLINLSREFNIDYTPKILLAGGQTQKCIIEFDLTTYVDFLLVPGSYIYKQKLYEIPTSETKALKSPLISFLQTPRVIKFFYCVRKYHQGSEITLKKTMREQFKHYSINDDTAQIICHAIALFTDDSFLDMCPKIIFDRIKLYIDSITMSNTEISAFIYPLYGVSDICQAFVRKAAVASATIRLRCAVSKIKALEQSEKEKYISLERLNINQTTSNKKIATQTDNSNRKKREKNNFTNKIEHKTKVSPNPQKDLLDKKIYQNTSELKSNGELNSTDTRSQIQSSKNQNSFQRSNLNSEESVQRGIYNFELDLDPKDGPSEKIWTRSIITTSEYAHKNRILKTGSLCKVVRVTLIIEGSVPLLKTVPSAQILFLSSGLNRKSDVFTLILGHREHVAPKGYKVVLLSYKKEGDSDQTIQKIIGLFGKVVDSFIREEEIYDLSVSEIPFWYFIRGSDESMHLENSIDEVRGLEQKLKKEGFVINSPFIS